MEQCDDVFLRNEKKSAGMPEHVWIFKVLKVEIDLRVCVCEYYTRKPDQNAELGERINWVSSLVS